MWAVRQQASCTFRKVSLGLVNDSEILVVLPTLGDRIDTLKLTLESIERQRGEVSLTLALVCPVAATEARALGQQHGAIIVDDPKVGISAAINAGLSVRDGEKYYAWMGDDDLFRDGGLRRLQDLIERGSSTVVAYGGCEYIDPEGRVLGTSAAGKLALLLLPWGPDLIPHPGSMIRLDALETIGRFDETLKYAMDLDAFLKLRELGGFASTRNVVSAFRWHPDSLTVANRTHSGAESEFVKRRHLPRIFRPIAPLWELPVRLASNAAARAVNRRGKTFELAENQA